MKKPRQVWVTSTGPSLSSGTPSPRELGPQTTTYKSWPLESARRPLPSQAHMRLTHQRLALSQHGPFHATPRQNQKPNFLKRRRVGTGEVI